MTIVEKSLELATRAHEGQFRRDGKTKYITHPIAVKDIALGWLDSGKEEIGEKLFDLIYYARQEALAFGVRYDQFKEILEIVGILHDGPEDAADKGFTVDYIISELKSHEEKIEEHYSPVFFELIKESLNALTHGADESYLDYILRAKASRISKIIKVADITHNISTRNGSNTAGEIKRDKIAIEKYQLAEYILLN